MSRVVREGRLAAALCVALLATGCAGAAAPGWSSASAGSSAFARSSASATASHIVSEVKVGFLEDLSQEGAATRIAPAFQAAKMAFDMATLTADLHVEVELVGFDTEGGAGTASEVARQIAEDPSYVAAIGAPYLGEQGAVVEVLDDADVPFITLSGLDPGLAGSGWTSWRRAVPTQDREAATLAGYVDSLRVARHGVCLAGDGSRVGATFLTALASSTTSRVLVRQRLAPTEESAAVFSEAVAASGCRVVVWGGFSAGAAALERHLVGVGLGKVRFVADGGVKDATYLQVAARAGDGTVVSCPCADVSTSTDLAAQRFVQDYQANYGLPPGSYAVEAWDVAHMLLGAFRSGVRTRVGALAYLQRMRSYQGLAGNYVFSANGDLERRAATVYLYRDEGGRWLPLARSERSHYVAPAGEPS